MKKYVFDELTSFLNRLERAHISYTLAHHREDAIMVSIATPGERWEVEFLEDGSVDVERFISEGNIYGAEVLHELFDQYANGGDNQVAQPPTKELLAVAT